MPRLLRGVARTTVIAGTATAVSNRVSRRQASRWAEQDSVQNAPPPAPPPAPPAKDPIDQLKELAALRSQGVLSEEEFQAQKAKIIAA